MIPQQFPSETFTEQPTSTGTPGPGFAGQPAPAAKPTGTNIWSDPNLMSIMLGELGQAIMGKHQDTWQAQMGKAATGLGRSFKMADVTARREAERKEERDRWRMLYEATIREGKPGGLGELDLGDISEPSSMMMG